MKKLKYKILFLSISLRRGGAENQLVKLALSLKKKGHDVTIIFFMQGNDFHSLLEQEALSTVFIPIKKPFGFFKLFKVVKELEPDVIISFMFGANLIGRALKVLHGIPLITSVRNNEISRLYKTLYRLSYNIDSLTTFNSQYALEKFKRERLSKRDKSILINNAVTFDSLEAKANFDSKGNFTFVSIAHFRPQKDYKTLFKAIKLVVDKGVKIELIVLGHLFNQEWPEEMLINLQINNIVRLVGFTNDTKTYLNRADGLVLSSLWEGTPNAILEAMANRLPVIASDIPGNRELIVKTEGGFLFEKSNTVDLADKLILLTTLSDADRVAMGRRGFEFVVSNYEESEVHKKWEDIISGVINR